MEAILKASVTSSVYGEQGALTRLVDICIASRICLVPRFRTPSAEILRELSDSRYTVYDVLPAFFCHEDSHVTLGET